MLPPVMILESHTELSEITWINYTIIESSIKPHILVAKEFIDKRLEVSKKELFSYERKFWLLGSADRNPIWGEGGNFCWKHKMKKY